MSKPKLFSPGPIMVKDGVRESMMHYDICHRSKEFEAMFEDVQEKILKLFNADDSYYSVVVSGSGTSANETVLSSIFKEGEGCLLIDNGEFGGRLYEILTKHNVPLVHAKFDWGTKPDLAEVEELIKANPQIKVVAMVYHETSSAMINPVPEVGALCKKYDKWYYVDSVSAAAGQHIDVVDNNITFTSSVGGKNLGAFPGSAYVCGKKEAFDSLTPEMSKTVYLSLYKHYHKALDASQTPNTPNVNVFWGLQQALADIIEEGLDARIARYQQCAKILRDGMRELGLTFLLPDEDMANTVTSVFLPKDKDLETFLSTMERKGYVVYAGKGIFYDQNMFQVANMGEIYPADCQEFLGVLKETLAEL